MLQAMLVTSFLGASLAVVGVQQFLGRSRWKLLDRLPLTPNGKCDRKRLEEMIQ